MIVVDTNIIAYLCIPGDHTTDVENLFRQESHWVAPFLWRSEFRKVLSDYIRDQKMTLEQARKLAEKAEALLHENEYFVTSSKVLELASTSRCSTYDCEFVILAQDLNIALVTMDKKILKAFPKTAVSISNFLK